MTMIDSFGVSTALGPVAASEGWRLFSLSAGDSGSVVADLLLLPNVRGGVLEGEVIEEIAVVRDEDANVAWAVERCYFDEEAGVRRNRGDEESGRACPRARAPASARTCGPPRLPPQVGRGGALDPLRPRLVEGQGASATQIYLRRARSLESASSADPQYRAG